jgi:hypothetical protein
MRAGIASGVVLLVGLFASPAQAATKQFAVKSASPANGAVIAPTNQLTFQIKTDAATKPFTTMWVELATASTPGQDGTLASEYTISSTLLSQGDAYPDTWTGSIAPVYPALAPGTYYWQVHFTQVDSAPPPTYSEINTYVSPTYTLVVQAPAPPTQPVEPMYLGKGEAIQATRDIIRDETGHKAYNLEHKCRRTSDTRFTCKPSWSTTRRATRKTWVYAGTLKLHETIGFYKYSFRGLRAKTSCIAHRSVQACARSVRW